MQHQPKLTWPTSFVVAKAYLDQLVRSKTMASSRANVLRSAMDRAEKSSGRDRAAAAAQVTTLAEALEADAAKASGIDAQRMKGAADVMKKRAVELK